MFVTRLYDLIFEIFSSSVNFTFVLFVLLKALELKSVFLIAYEGLIWEIANIIYTVDARDGKVILRVKSETQPWLPYELYLE